MPSSRIAIDAMGGDEGVRVMVSGAALARRRHEGFQFLLVGDQKRIERALEAYPNMREASEILHCEDVVAGDERPTQALRRAKTTSMGLAINAVKTGDCGAAVSAGNTGALMAMARYVLKMLPGIDRPAICSALPTLEGHTYVLDLGANADCTAEQLVQFAAMGSALVSALDENPAPSVGLLNIGEEQIKGNERVKQADAGLRHSGLNYYGYVEGHHINAGLVDVVVTDGFAGNVALKAIEGTAHFIGQMLREEFTRNPLTRLEGLIAWPTLTRLRRRLDPQRYNGASFLGLRGIVVKSHGGADRVGFETAVHAALVELEQAVPERISRALQETSAMECGS